MKKTITLLLLFFCGYISAYADEIIIEIKDKCKLDTRHKTEFSWDFKSELTLQTTGIKDNYKKITAKSSIEITYTDESKDNIKLTDLVGLKEDFKPVSGKPNTYKATLLTIITTKISGKKVKSVVVHIKCDDNNKIDFTITNSSVGTNTSQGSSIVQTYPCHCENDKIYPMIARAGADTCSNTRELKYNHKCNPQSFFGELPCYYTKDHITYIYDFNKDISKRGFFKVTKFDSGLKVEPVNWHSEKLKPRNIVNFKVVHINKFMYNVSIADTLVKYDSEPSSLFNNFFLGDTNLLASLMTSFSDGLSGVSHKLGIDPDTQVIVELSPIMCKINCFIKKYNGLHAKMLQAYNPCSEFPCCTAEDYYSLANDLLEIKLLSAKDETLFNELLKQLNEKQTALNTQNSKQKELDGMKKQLDEIKKKKPEDRTADDKKMLEKETELQKDLLNAEDLKKLKDEIVDKEKQMEPFKGLQSLHESLPDIADIRQMIVFLNNMVEQQQTYMTEITSLKGNRLDVILNIAAKDSIGKIVPALKDFQFERHIEIPIIHRWFPSFSAGSFIGFSKSLKNKTYEWRRLPSYGNVVDDTSKYELAESGYSLPPMGFAALGNLEYTCAPGFGLGLSVGVGLTIETKPRLGYLAGGSLFFGDNRQFGLTCGIMAAQVEQLNNNLNVGQLVYSQTNKPDIIYYKELKTGGFISLTYTPFTESRKK